MAKISSASLADLCSEVFGVELELDRLETLAGELETILGEVKKLRELDLADMHPVVVFDPETVYRDRES